MSDKFYVFVNDATENTFILTISIATKTVLETKIVTTNFPLGFNSYIAKILGATIHDGVLYASVEDTNLSDNNSKKYYIYWTDSFTLGQNIQFLYKQEIIDVSENPVIIYGLTSVFNELYGISGTNTDTAVFTVYKITNTSGTISIEQYFQSDGTTFSPLSLSYSGSKQLISIYNNNNIDYIKFINIQGESENSIGNVHYYAVISLANDPLDYTKYYYDDQKELRWLGVSGLQSNTTTIASGYSYPVLFFDSAACIHSSSKVLLSDGSYKLITNVTSGDQVYSPDCKTAVVKEVVPCWLKVPNNPFHKCVVFEKDSLAPNVPSELFIIDPGHPMSFATNYDNNGLMSAKEYVNGKTIYTSDYNDIKERFPEDMKHNRYDLVLNRGDTYVANNVIVKSRTSFKTAGYDLEVD